MNRPPIDERALLGEHQSLGPLSLEDRQRLVAERGDVLRLLLDLAFSEFYDAQDLHPYGFRGEDPVQEAVEWALAFFASERFRPEKQRERTTRLFTCPALWLSLKVGRRAWGARKGRRREDTDPDSFSDAPPSRERARQDAALAETRDQMGQALGQLRARTCASVVGHWLEGSERLRATLFGWEVAAEVPDGDLSKGARSKLRHDAQFRYICLFIGILDDDSADEAHQAVLRISFAPCEDRRPYRVLESQAVKLWPRAIGTAALLSLRKEGLRALVSQALDEAERPADTPKARLRGLVLRHGLSKTTAYAYKLDGQEGDALLARLAALTPPEVRG